MPTWLRLIEVGLSSLGCGILIGIWIVYRFGDALLLPPSLMILTAGILLMQSVPVAVIEIIVRLRRMSKRSRRRLQLAGDARDGE